MVSNAEMVVFHGYVDCSRSDVITSLLAIKSLAAFALTVSLSLSRRIAT